MTPKVIAVVGPTASGKSSLGVFLAQKLGGEIISADSRQVYKGLNIGTGKITEKEMAGVPHHLLDVASPKRQFSASDFERLGRKALFDILKKNKLPLVVGGTGFYVDTLLGRITLLDVPPNPSLRAKLENKTVAELFAMLKKKDPARAKTIEPNHKRRLIRAIEIAVGRSTSASKKVWRKGFVQGEAETQKPRTPEDFLSSTRAKPHILWLGIKPSEEALRKKIHARLHARVQAGMLSEAKRLHTQGLSYKRMKELGLEYRSLAEYLLGEKTKEEMLASLEAAINHYAKRQNRWFKRNKEIRWVTSKGEALRLAKAFISG